MMKAMRRMLLPAVLVLMPCLLSAQNFRGGYFLDGYLLGYKSNPAFANDTDFISLFLGQSVTSVKSDLSLKNLLYPGPGGESLVTEMTPQLAPPHPPEPQSRPRPRRPPQPPPPPRLPREVIHPFPAATRNR